MAFQRKKPAAIGLKAKFPGFIEPALATSIEKVPTGTRWLHEIKFDGYRVQLHVANENVAAYTRRGNDWTKRFTKIANDAFLVSASSAIIDGEIVVPAACAAPAKSEKVANSCPSQTAREYFDPTLLKRSRACPSQCDRLDTLQLREPSPRSARPWSWAETMAVCPDRHRHRPRLHTGSPPDVA